MFRKETLETFSMIMPRLANLKRALVGMLPNTEALLMTQQRSSSQVIIWGCPVQKGLRRAENGLPRL